MMGRNKKPVPGPLQAATAQVQAHQVPHTPTTGNPALRVQVVQVHSPTQVQGSHSAQVVPTLGLHGETPCLASTTVTSTNTSTSTASPSASSVSPTSPRSPYSSKFSPKNLTHCFAKSPLLSPGSSQLQPRSHPATPREAVPHQPQEAIVHTGPHPARSQHRSPLLISKSSASDSKQPHIAELHQHFPPITKAVTASSHQQSIQHHPQHHHLHHRPEHRLKSSHGGRHADDKSAPIIDSDASTNLSDGQNHVHNNQGFQFDFSNNTAESSHCPLPPPLPLQALQPVPSQSQSQSTHAAMSATDHQPAIAKQGSSQSETAYAPRPSLPARPETSPGHADPVFTPASTKKHSKPKPFTLLSRTKSHHEKNGRTPRHTPSPHDTTKDAAPVLTPTSRTPRVPIMELNPPDKAHVPQGPRTAPVAQEAAYREAMSSSSRNHSVDRTHSRDASSDRRGHQESQSRSHQSTPRDNNGASSFFNNLRREGGRVAETIGKGLFGKGGRSASTTERDPVDDEHYMLKVITLPLVEQTRLTRISKRLEESRDKTEFWMPAFPWRAIDYLNYKGCDVEGLYRVPGSGPQIKKWQRRFDEQHDVDLFTQDDLYDINIIGSMLKAWLRELPDELFPKEAQDRIARECSNSETVPQMLIDELSNLSPFNYYLLFAITCHLSLLLAHSDKNKMDFRNLCICFQPCMKIDAFCFRFLVCEWRDCWKGCRTEARYIEEEYKIFDQPPPPGLGIKKRLEPRVEGLPSRRPSPAFDRGERDERERNLSSAESSGQKSQQSGDQAKLKKKSPPPLEHGREMGATTAVPRTAHADLEAHGVPRESSDQGGGDMRPLSPIQPLSPLGF